jgi:hypothetical protein
MIKMLRKKKSEIVLQFVCIQFPRIHRKKFQLAADLLHPNGIDLQ